MRCAGCARIASRCMATRTCRGCAPASAASRTATCPTGAARRALYEQSRERLEGEGYREIGLDHFALESDSLWHTAARGPHASQLHGLHQRAHRAAAGPGRVVDRRCRRRVRAEREGFRAYQQRIAARRAADPARPPAGRRGPRAAPAHPEPDDAPRDRLVGAGRLHAQPDRHRPAAGGIRSATACCSCGADGCRVTGPGRGFLRNICMAFDARLARQQPDRPLFSRSA